MTAIIFQNEFATLSRLPLTPPISPPRSRRLRGSSRGSARRCTSPRFQSQLDLDLDRWSNLKLQTESSRAAVLCQARTSSRHRQSTSEATEIARAFSPPPLAHSRRNLAGAEHSNCPGANDSARHRSCVQFRSESPFSQPFNLHLHRHRHRHHLH